jgi:hypothetical protein
MVVIVLCVVVVVISRNWIGILATDEADSVSFHHFFAALIQTYPAGRYIDEPSCLVEICYAYPAFDHIICIYWSEKDEGHLVCDKIEIATDFRGQCSSGEPLRHQPSLFVGLDVMNALVSGEFAKQSYIFFSEGAFPWMTSSTFMSVVRSPGDVKRTLNQK